jgi:hypothetical protein
MRRPPLLGAGFAVALAASYAAAQVPSSQYPEGAIPLMAAATGTTAGATATLAAAPGKINYLCGISVTPGSATTAIVITVTTTGFTNNFTWSVGAPATAAGVTGSPLNVSFNPCVPSNTPNTAITVAAGALGAGGAGQDVNIAGYQR